MGGDLAGMAHALAAFHAPGPAGALRGGSVGGLTAVGRGTASGTPGAFASAAVRIPEGTGRPGNRLADRIATRTRDTGKSGGKQGGRSRGGKKRNLESARS